ncbi:MAG TPA: trypsin-like peptidase domain-containing protein, partial [Dehalococcoidia bacterium]|nr:trypsin-like peptidase domain-containing protein [Dehalococcoidia bacterium]
MYSPIRVSLKIALFVAVIFVLSGVVGCGGPPVAQFQASAASGQAPFSVTFTNQSKNAAEFTWDFGDGETKTTTSAKESVYHEFKKAGSLTVKLTATQKGDGPQTSSVTTTVVVSPAALAGVVLIPADASLTPDGKQAFSAEARDQFGNVVPDVKFTFRADSRAGQVDSSGGFVAGKKAGSYDGAVTAEATEGGTTKTAAAKVTVNPGTLDHVLLNPATVQIVVGKTQDIAATPVDAYDNPVSGAQLNWSADKAAGVIDNGKLTAATKAGSFPNSVTVTGSSGSASGKGTASVTLVAGPLDHVQVSPAKADLNIGKSQDFTATPVDVYDNPVSGAQVTWIIDQAAGSADGGRLTAGTQAGTYVTAMTAKATSSSLTGTGSASVTVKPDPLDSVTVTPAQVQAGGTAQLKAVAKDKYGNQVSDVQLVWSVTDDNAGSVTGAGALTAGQVARQFPSSVQAKATQGDIVKTVSAQITITPGPLAQVVVGPGQVELGMGMTQQFVAVGADQYGNRISGLSLTWSVESGGGTIDSKGLFTASATTGTYNKTVKAESKQGDITRSAAANVIVEPDRIAFTSNRNDDLYDVYIMGVDGTQVKRLTTGADAFAISWSPDGRRLVFDYFVASPFSLRIIVMDDEGDWMTDLDAADSWDPAWSPDGGKIAYLHWVAGTTAATSSYELYVMDADGGNKKRLTSTPGGEFAPAWSPDGSKIAYDYTAPGGGGDIWVINADGSNPKQLTSHSADDSMPTWSPDGTRIAFTSDRDGDYEIFVMNADGSNLQQLTANSGPVDIFPNWSSDGRKIAFSSTRDTRDTTDIYIMNSDGSNLVRLTNDTADDYGARWAPRKKGVSVNEASLVIPDSKALKPLTVQQITAQARKAVVRIETDLGKGSGFIIDPNGLILTANHVISDAKEINVFLDDGTKYTGTIKGRDLVRDIAIVEIKATGLSFLKLGDLS